MKESPEPNGVWEDGAREYCGKWGRLFVWSGVKGIVRFRAVTDGGIIGTVDVWTGKWTTSGSPVGE